MNKAELSEKLAEKTNVSKKQAEEMVETLIDIITSTLSSGGGCFNRFWYFFSEKKSS